jgi:hypothetical protein
MTSPLWTHYTTNTAGLLRVLTAFLSLGEEQCHATRRLEAARLQEILDERQMLSDILDELLRERQQWRRDLQQSSGASVDTERLLPCLAQDDSTLADLAQQVMQCARKAEALLCSTVDDLRVQLQAERQRGCLEQTYYHASQPTPLFVDKVDIL